MLLETETTPNAKHPITNFKPCFKALSSSQKEGH
jgi:hypothetical protein